MKQEASNYEGHEGHEACRRAGMPLEVLRQAEEAYQRSRALRERIAAEADGFAEHLREEQMAARWDAAQPECGQASHQSPVTSHQSRPLLWWAWWAMIGVSVLAGFTVQTLGDFIGLDGCAVVGAVWMLAIGIFLVALAVHGARRLTKGGAK